jgi:hypothetical protein
MDDTLLVDMNIIAADDLAPARNLFRHQSFTCRD